MARNVKPGITFYRMDSGHIINKKVRLLFNDSGSDGYYIWSCLIDHAYKENGYFFNLNDADQLELFATEYCKKDLELIRKVIQVCIKRELFHKDIAANYNILTSVMMQEVFVFATAERRKKGSSFEVPECFWLLSEEFVNISITPGSYPQTKTIDKDNRQRQDLRPSNDGHTDKILKITPAKAQSGGQDASRQKIQPPDIAAVKSYFLQQYNPRNPGSWFPDKCNTEAMLFFSYYKANGWKQGKKKIVDWTASADSWILNAKTGLFSHQQSVPASKGSPPAADQHRSNINPLSKDINFLYEQFVENPVAVTYRSIDAMCYDHLKQKKMISFTDDKIQEIKQQTITLLEKLEIQTNEAMITVYMKKIAVIELFKQYNTEGKELIFKL